MQGCTDTLMCSCRDARWTAARTYGCTDKGVHLHTNSWLQGLTVDRCTDARIHGCSGAQAYSCAVAGAHGEQLHGRRDAQMQWCTDTLMCGCMCARWTAARTQGRADTGVHKHTHDARLQRCT
jgi:hypothetical protein